MTSAQIEPDVSVVVPVWGDYAGKPLDEALDGLRAQDLRARIIVVDNASEPPLRDLPGVEIVRSAERLSVGAARNLGLRMVESPYVLFWDADDLILPGTLSFLRDRLASAPDAVVAAAAIMEGDPLVPHRWPRRWTYPLTRRRRLFALADSIWSLFPSTGCSLIRTAPAREAGFADANSGEDWVLGVSLALRGRVILEARPGRIYRRHPASLWETQRSAAQLARHARTVRDRIRRDPAAPRWMRLLLPGIAVFQLAAVYLVRPLVEMMRVIRPNPRS